MIYPGMARVVSHRAAPKQAGQRIHELEGPQVPQRSRAASARQAPLADPMQAVFTLRSKPTRKPVPDQAQRPSGYLTAPFLAKGAANDTSSSPRQARNGAVAAQSCVPSPRLQQVPLASLERDQPGQQPSSEQVLQQGLQEPQQAPPQQRPQQVLPIDPLSQPKLEVAAMQKSSLQPQINALGAVADKFCPAEINILKIVAEALVFTGLVLLKWAVSLSKPQRITAVLKAGLVILFFALHPIYASIAAAIVLSTYMYEKVYMRRPAV